MKPIQTVMLESNPKGNVHCDAKTQHFHSHWISHSPSLLDRTIFFGMRTGSFWGSKVRVSLTPILITFLSRQPRFCLSRWSGGHRFPVSLVTQAHLTALLFLNGRTPSGRIFLRVRQGPQQLNLLVDLGVTCCAQCAGVWPRVWCNWCSGTGFPGLPRVTCLLPI